MCPKECRAVSANVFGRIAVRKLGGEKEVKVTENNIYSTKDRSRNNK